MKSYEVIRDTLEREGITGYQLSHSIGCSNSYVTNIINIKKDPRVSTLTKILDALGYDLVARSREDGFEFEIDS